MLSWQRVKILEPLVLVTAVIFVVSCGSGRDPMDATPFVEAVDGLPVLDQREYDFWGTLQRHYVVVLGEIVDEECQMETEVHCAVAALNDEGHPFDDLEVFGDSAGEYSGGSDSFSRIGDWSCGVEVYAYDINSTLLDSNPEVMEPVEGRDARWYLWFVCDRYGSREGETPVSSVSD